MSTAQILGHQGDFLLAEKVADKEAVQLPDPGSGRIVGAKHGGAAEGLASQVFALCAQFEHGVDQLLHGVDAVTGRFRQQQRDIVAIDGPAQKKVVHADDMVDRVVQAGGHAGAQQGREAFGLVGGVIVAG